MDLTSQSLSINWLFSHVVADIESLRTDCALPQAQPQIEALLAAVPSPVLDRMGASGDLGGALDLVIVDRPERLASRDRLTALSARSLPLRTCSVYVVTDVPVEAEDEVAKFRQRVEPQTFAFASKIVEMPPTPATLLVERELPAYMAWLLDRRLDEVAHAASDRLTSMSPIDNRVVEGIRADIEHERRWIRERFRGLRADLRVVLREDNPIQHATRLLHAVERDVSARYGIDEQTLIEVGRYAVPKPNRRRSIQLVELGIDVYMSILTNGLWLLRRLSAIVGQPAGRDPRDEALLAVFDRDLGLALERLTRDVDFKLVALASARATARYPDYAELQHWRGIVGRAIALKRRLKAPLRK